jgi:hypothetical protein
MQDREVGSKGEMSYPEIEIVLGLINAVDLDSRRHPHLEGRLKHLPLHGLDVR